VVAGAFVGAHAAGDEHVEGTVGLAVPGARIPTPEGATSRRHEPFARVATANRRYPRSTGRCRSVRIDAVACRTSLRRLCRRFGSAPCIATLRRTAMVRNGSPVRVRQRALRKGLDSSPFRDPAGEPLRAVLLRRPHLGRVREVSACAEGVQTRAAGGGARRTTWTNRTRRARLWELRYARRVVERFG
jgi:hypothetical protein